LSNSRDLALHISDLAFDKKAFNLQILDVADLVGYCNYIVICSGRSDRQVQAIADNISICLKKEKSMLPTGVEGQNSGQWALLDYGDVVVHVFNAPVRDYYDMESLWRKADKVPVKTPPWEAEMKESLMEHGIF